MLKVCLKVESSLISREVHSDTLFGALCWGYRHLFGESALVSLLESFDSNPPFIISSCFPWIEYDDERVYFYPKPYSFRVNWKNKKAANRFNKLKYIPEGLFRSITEGRLSSNDLSLQNNSRKNFKGFEAGEDYIIRNGIAIPKDLAEYGGVKALFEKSEVPGNAINRLSMSTEENLYFREEFFPVKDTGIFFLIDGGSKELERVKASLNYLKDRGLGGKISIGKGQFDVQYGEEDIRFQPPEDSFVTLSLYQPTRDELSSFNGNNVCYEPVIRKGKVENAFIQTKNPWKDKLLMFSEGSVFPASGKNYYGSCPVVREKPFQIRHYAYAFPVGMKTEDKK